MLKILIVFSSILIIGISFLLFKKAAGSISPFKLNTISYVFYYQIIISTVIASVIVVVVDMDYHYMYTDVKYLTKLKGWVWVMYSLIAIPLGMLILALILKVNPTKRFNQYLKTPIKSNISENRQNIFLLLSVLFSLFCAGYIFINSPSYPLLSAIKGASIETVNKLRFEVRNNFEGIIYIKNLLALMLVPILSYYSFVQYINKKSFLRLSIFIVNFLIVAFILTFDTQKAQFVFYLFGYIIIYVSCFGEISKKAFIKYVLSGLLIIILFYALLSGKNLFSILYYKSSFFNRIFLTSYGGYILSLEWFPEIININTSFIGVPNFLLDLFNQNDKESARLIMERLSKSYPSEGGNLVSSYFLGEAWANYGYLGLIISPIIVGFNLQFVHLFFTSRNKDPLKISVYAYITTKWLIHAGFVNFLFLKQLIFPLFIYFFLKIFLNSISKISLEK